MTIDCFHVCSCHSITVVVIHITTVIVRQYFNNFRPGFNAKQILFPSPLEAPQANILTWASSLTKEEIEKKMPRLADICGRDQLPQPDVFFYLPGRLRACFAKMTFLKTCKMYRKYFTAIHLFSVGLNRVTNARYNGAH